MSRILIVLALAGPMAVLPALSHAKGCLKGAAVGGVAGHVAGHHGLVGVAAGCAIEHHREKVKDRAPGQPPVPSPDHVPVPVTTNSGTTAK